VHLLFVAAMSNRAAPSSATAAARLVFAGTLAFHALLAALLCAAGLGSAYLPASWALSMSVAWLLTRVLARRALFAAAPVVALGSALPLVFTADMSLNLLQFFSGLAGRLGFAAPGDAIVGALAALLAGLALLPLHATVVATRSTRAVSRILLVVGVCAMAAAFLSTAYTAERPKRVFMQHLQRGPTADGTASGFEILSHVWFSTARVQG
jgi:hypothetical protein